MATRMTHPKHGATYAVGAEIAWNQSNGWKIEPEPQAPVVEPKKEPPSADTPERSPSELYEAKFGKPPHHRMRPETIEKALEDDA